jgi:surface antigen/endonuclease/exonuclease/phosphatase family metal-dependent hydrolase
MANDLQTRPNDSHDDELDPEQRYFNDVFNGMVDKDNYAKEGKSGDLGGDELEKLGGDTGSTESGSGTSTTLGAASDDEEPVGKFRKGLRKTKAALWGTKLRRRSTTTGGIVSLLVGAASGGSLYFSGPFELIHVAQFMHKVHFQTQEDQGDERMGKLYRFLNTGGDVGETRLNYLGSKYKTTMLKELSAKGLKPKYTGVNKVLSGFTIDTENPESPYAGLSDEDVRSELRTAGLPDSAITADKGTITVDVSKTSHQKIVNRILVKKLGYKGIPGALRTRILNKYGLVDWHPLHKLDTKLNESLAKRYAAWKEEREKRLKTGVGESDVHGTATEREADANGNTTDTASSDADTSTSSDIIKDPTKSTSALKEIASSRGAKVTGGLAAVQGLACGAKALADGIDNVHYVQVVAPLIRMGMDAKTTGEQVQSGKDIDKDVAGFAKKSLHGTDPATGQKTDWNQATSIQAAMGNANSGIDAPEAYKGIGEGIPSWLQWTQSGIVAATCGTAGQIVGGVVSIGLTVASGGFVSAVGGQIVSMVAAPKIIGAMTAMLAGDAVNVAAQGAEWGSGVDYGNALAKNAAVLGFGGAPLSKQEVAELNADNDAADSADFATKSFAYRMFNPSDNRTLAAKLIDDSYGLQPQNIASTMGSVLTNFGTLLRAPAGILSATTHAAAAPYDYGFDDFGFSKEDMDNPLVNNPYENATAAGKILDGPDGKGGAVNQTYIDRAESCFGVKISEGDNGWEAAADPGAGGGTGINSYAKDYNKNGECRDKGNNDWLRIRFFIFDMGEMEGWACYNGDSISCLHDGVEDAPNSTTDGSSFKVASFNVEGASHTGTFKARMDNSISTITSSQLDIVGLQELQTVQRNYMMDQISSTYDIYPKTAANQGHVSENSIIWNKSKYKLVEGGTQPNLQYFDGSVLNAPYVRLQDIATGQQFFVLNTHDPANTKQNPGQQGYRLHNAQEHVKFIQKIGSDGTPVVFTGDFNSGYTVRPGGANGSTVDNKAENLTYCVMTRGGTINDAYDVYKNRTATCPNPQVPPDSGSNAYGGIDHIFTSKTITVSSYTRLQNGATNNGSDHPTLIVDATIPPTVQAGGGAAGAGTPGSDFVGNQGFGGGSCVEYVKYILARHSSSYHSGSLGDGKDVANTIGKMGYTVNHTPAIHATVSFPTSLANPQFGHVALVAAIHNDGSITVEESNWSTPNRYGTHVVKAGEVKLLTYAHTEVGWH